MRLKFILFAALVLLSLASRAEACLSTPEQRREAFDDLDDDKDGFLTQEEYYNGSDAVSPERQAAYIAELDTDKDGKISFEEFSAMKQKQRC